MKLNDKLRKRRLELDMTLEDVGNIVGVSKSTVKKWESGDIENMRRDKIELLAKALKVGPGFVMGWEDDEDCKVIEIRPKFELSLDEERIINKYRSFPQKYKNKVFELIEGIEKEIKDDREFNELLKKAQSLVEGKVAAYGGKMESVTLTAEESAELDELLKKAIAENGELL